MASKGFTTEVRNRLNGFDDGFGYFIDLDGNPVERTPCSHPYSYDAYVVYKAEDFDPRDKWAYSDRLLQWNREAFQNAYRAIWPDQAGSQTLTGRKPKDINRFLNLYFGKEVKLTAVQQACNVSTGYPYWVFIYREVK